MDIKNVVIGRANQIGTENKNRSRPMVPQSSFYKDEYFKEQLKNLKI